jgi:hypothetical protein
MFLVRAEGFRPPTLSPFSVFPAAAIPRTYLPQANTLIHTIIILLTLARPCIESILLCLGSMRDKRKEAR